MLAEAGVKKAAALVSASASHKDIASSAAGV